MGMGGVPGIAAQGDEAGDDVSYRLRRGEGVGQGMRRVVAERIEAARSELARPAAQRHEAIHEARKRFKEIRAALRLLRGPLAEAYARENAWFRDAGRRLAAARDAQALLETWDKLDRAYPRRLRSAAMGRCRGRLEQRLAQVTAVEVEDSAALEQVCDELARAQQRIAGWPLPSGGGFRLLAPGWGRIYRQGRRRLKQAYRDGSDEAFHEWRKRIKDHWYHTRLLQLVWPEEMQARRTALKALSDLVGDDHDLAVLRATIAQEPALFGATATRRSLLGLAGRRQEDLRSEARTLGRRVYAERPDAHLERLQAYWRVWRS